VIKLITLTLSDQLPLEKQCLTSVFVSLLTLAADYSLGQELAISRH